MFYQFRIIFITEPMLWGWFVLAECSIPSYTMDFALQSVCLVLFQALQIPGIVHRVPECHDE